MSTSNSSWHQTPQKASVEWVCAIAGLCVLSAIYFSRNAFENDFAENIAPRNESVNFAQNQYWNEDFQYWFRGENDDKYQNKVMSGADIVAVDSKEGVVFEDAKVKVSYYPQKTIEEVRAIHESDLPRTYTRLSRGVAVVEGDLNSPSVKTIMATLYAQ